ncbi:hypothetical protein [Moraxella sp.]|uniref:hypothetical protein n=1 Tax=Moraxella sp. TaxID=479 RepID=UPI0026DDB0D4|nr:hypothetical protein [Moraxella sp.]MDO4895270.1 hypothetical protein [Moraxella sp.]
MKLNTKLLIATLLASFALTACDKPAQDGGTTSGSVAKTADADKHEHHDHDDKNEHHDDKDEHHDHEHDEHHDEHHDHEHEHGHDHEHHGHDHHHDDGDAYQCADKTVRIAIHNHEGEMEAHLTHDDIQYDLNQDPNNANLYTTNDGIQGDNKPMSLSIDGNKVKVLAADQSTLLDCVKQ